MLRNAWWSVLFLSKKHFFYSTFCWFVPLKCCVYVAEIIKCSLFNGRARLFPITPRRRWIENSCFTWRRACRHVRAVHMLAGTESCVRHECSFTDDCERWSTGIVFPHVEWMQEKCVISNTRGRQSKTCTYDFPQIKTISLEIVFVLYSKV